MTTINRPMRRVSYIVLCLSLFVVTLLFAIPARYSSAAQYGLAFVQIAPICCAAWILGASAIRTGSEEYRRMATGGALLIVPWILFSTLSGLGSPWQATVEENRLRFLILACAAMSVTTGLVILRETLNKFGENYYSVLGFAATLLAGPLFDVFASTEYEYFTWKALHPGHVPPWIDSLSDLREVLLFFSGTLTYLATAAFAASLGRVKLLGRIPTRAFVLASFVAVVLLSLRGVEYPDLSAGYLVPTLIVGIPAIAWIMPLMLAVVLLQRAGDEHESTLADA